MIKVKVNVSLKPDVMDPRGITIRNALQTLGFSSVSRVDAGKFFVLYFDTDDEEQVNEQITKICHDVLSNPVIEDYSFSIETNSSKPGSVQQS